MQVRKHAQQLRTDSLRDVERSRCRNVIDAYKEVKSTIGTAGAIDYSKITGGRGAQFSDTGKNLPLIDFIVDVENAISEVLCKESDLNVATIFDTSRDITSDEVMELEEKLGRAFVGRKIWPLNQYFVTVKK